ncbi:MAG: hybrid sensor histidine kinase/response regulator [Betaproteobacteria bacterium]|nr:hybrid sensor histidine kinase/response regulator [Betaproteobacteria bacterium]
MPIDPPQARLLLVDDDATVIRTMSRMLDGFGHLRFASSGWDALAIAREWRPDLVLLDVEMPGLSGLDVCELFRADPRLATVPLLMVTSHQAQSLGAMARAHGAVGLITKPMAAAALQAQVRAVLRGGAPAPAAASAPPTPEPTRASRGDRAESADAPAWPPAAHGERLAMSFFAHEVGNALNGLLGQAELMHLDRTQALPPAQAQRLTRLLEAGRTVRQLLRDIVELGALGSGRLPLRLEALDADRCVDDAAAAVAALARMAGVPLRTTGAPLRPAAAGAAAAAGRAQVLADAARLQQCLVNLLSNAIKYNRPGGGVRVRVVRGTGWVRIAVRDNGIGLSEQQMKHLFEPFNRLGRERGVATGSGLGLVITRSLLQAMDGRLVVRSRAGRGSCFAIELPQAPAAPAGPPRTTAPPLASAA